MAIDFLVAMRLAENMASPLKRVAEAANHMGQAAQRMSADVKAASVTLGTLTAAADATLGVFAVKATEVEDALARLETATVTTTTTMSEALQNATANAIEFSTQYNISIEKVIQAQFLLATAGVKTEEQLEAVRGAFKLAQAGVGDFFHTTELLGQFLNTFGQSVEFKYLGPVEKVEAITDRVALAVQRFQATLPTLAESLKFVIGPANQLGIGLSELVAELGILNTAGFRGSLAGTALSNVFNRIGIAAEKLDLNESEFIDLEGNLKSLTAFLDELNRSFAEITPIEAMNKAIGVFDIRAGRVITTMRNTVDSLKRYTAEFDLAAGATQQMADVIQSTTSQAFGRFINSIQNVGITIAGPLIQSIRVLLDTAITPLLAAFNDFLTITGPLIPVLITGTAALATLAATTILVVRGIQAVSGALAILSTAANAATLSITGLSARFLIALGVITKFTAIGAAVGFAIYGIIKLFDKFEEFIGLKPTGIEETNQQFGNMQERLSVILKQIHGIGTALEHNLQQPVARGTEFGDLPFLKRITEIFKNEAPKDLSEAIRQAIKETASLTTVTQHLADASKLSADEMLRQAQVIGIIKQVAEAARLNTEEVLRNAQAFDEFKSKFDASFKNLNDVQKAEQFFINLAESFQLVISGISNNIPETIDAIRKLTSVFDELNKVRGLDKQQEKAAELFELINNNIDNLRRIESPAIQDLIRLIEIANKNDGEFATDSLIQLITLRPRIGEFVKDFEQLVNNSQQFTAQLKEVDIIANRTRASTSAISNILKNAELGADDFGKAIEKADKKIEETRQNIQNMEGVLKVLEESFGKLDPRLLDTEEAKKAKDLLEKQLEILVKMRVDFDEAQIQADASRIFGIIRDLAGPLTRTAVKDINKLGEVFSSTISNALSGKIQGREIFRGLYDDFRLEFLNQTREGLSKIIGVGFFKEFRAAISAVNSEINKLASQGFDFKVGLETGDLIKRLEEVAGIAAPALKKAFGSFFNLGQLQQDIQELATAFQNTIGDALTGQTIGAKFFTSLSDDFKTKFVNEFKEQIANLFGERFQPQFRQAIDIMTKELRRLDAAGIDLSQLLVSGDLQNHINTLLRNTVPGLEKIIGLSDILDIERDNKLLEKFRNLATDIQVAFVTAGGVSRSFLGDLSRILDEGPAKGFEQQIEQASRLRELLKNAVDAGAKDAIGPIEQALRAALEPLNQARDNDPAVKMASALQSGANVINLTADNFSDKTVNAANSFSEIIGRVVDKLGNLDFKGVASELESIIQQSKTLATPGGEGADKITGALRTGADIIGISADNFSVKTIDAAKSFSDIIRSGIERLASISNFQNIGSGIVSIIQAAQDAASSLNFDDITAVIRAAGEQLNTGAVNIQNVINQLPAAARNFSDQIKTGLSEAAQTFSNVQVEAVKDATRPIEVRVNNGERRIEVTVSGTTSGLADPLQESEIRRIVEETRTSMMAELEGQLRNLENELRRR